MQKELIKIINEEISDFDFLNNDKQLNEIKDIELLNNIDFQKQFIVDFLLHPEKFNVDLVDTELEEELLNDEGLLTVKYHISITYKYDTNEEPINFDLIFSSDGIPTNKEINWEKFTVDLFTTDGDEIKFKAFKSAPSNIKKIFIREFINEYVSNLLKNE